MTRSSPPPGPNASNDTDTPPALPSQERSETSALVVTPAEGGQKLFQYLKRRAGLPGGAVMKLVRTGQVRVDGKRAKPYDRVAAGQRVRVPPRLLEELRARDAISGEGAGPGAAAHPDDAGATAPEALAAACAAVGLPCVARGPGWLALFKPSGLRMHGDEAVNAAPRDSVDSRLAAAAPGADFAPTPAHRLDRATSGLLLVAVRYEALAALHRLFRKKTQQGRDGVGKRYLAWVEGAFPEGLTRLEDELAKVRRGRMGVTQKDAGKKAVAEARLLERRGGASLVEVDLRTGRTHQIRLQLASRGFPILGDVKYGETPPARHGLPWGTLLLHAWRLELHLGEEPVLAPAPGMTRVVVEALPPWPAPFQPPQPPPWPGDDPL